MMCYSFQTLAVINNISAVSPVIQLLQLQTELNHHHHMATTVGQYSTFHKVTPRDHRPMFHTCRRQHAGHIVLSTRSSPTLLSLLLFSLSCEVDIESDFLALNVSPDGNSVVNIYGVFQLVILHGSVFPWIYICKFKFIQLFNWSNSRPTS